jgi:restriction system protein
VGVRVVREFYDVISAQGAAGDFVVTSGKFTQEARRFAQDCGVELIDGERLESLIRNAERTRLPKTREP